MRERRAHGPYKHGKKWRVVFVVGCGTGRTTSYEAFASRAAAEACLAGARDESQGTTVSGAIVDFVAAKRTAGLLPETLESYERWLRTLLAPYLGRAIRAVIGRGAELYAEAQGPRRADTHRNFLVVGRMWGRFCVKRGWLKTSPFADIDAAGRRTVGADKSRLTVDESRRLDAWCRSRPGDQAAVLTLAYLLLGARASELVKRDVRDLDDGGRLLWIDRTKTAAGRRRLRLPDELAALLVGLVSDRPGDAPIFTDINGKRMSRHVARLRVRAVCKAAGVAILSPQALRRTQATLATDAGETALAVARHLGHATGAAPAVTERSYVARAAASDARGERAQRLIRGPGIGN